MKVRAPILILFSMFAAAWKTLENMRHGLHPACDGMLMNDTKARWLLLERCWRSWKIFLSLILNCHDTIIHAASHSKKTFWSTFPQRRTDCKNNRRYSQSRR